MSAFLDTSALYPYFVRNDERHGDVLNEVGRLLQERRALWTTSYVLTETIALLQRRFGLAPVRDLSEQLLPVLSVAWVSEPLHQRALERLFRENRRNLSLVDCVSFEFMDAQGLREALALDQHFVEAGYRLIP